ncbi:transporter [Heyndrickxia shackletonii]|uniref:Transporter n=1 Tax=Heyndrickxia shackletonii TaxID=157838 RepID=A0A0Q3TAH4_9BACI|nr:AEC family transporter [Heyndrickxia shackletonii]KQL50537.1 transporter [Heyndrickxia shackletonii]NEY98155.1 AEC family transporter [Heyndrickxia shackletonii]
MSVFLLIGLNVILPVFILIGAGVFLHRKFKFDMNTLSKLNTFFLMPAVSFVNIYQNNVGGKTLLHILGFLILQCVCLMSLSAIISKAAKFESSLASTFKNSIVLNNSGNFGLPVSQLVFQHSPLGASIQIVVMIFQNLLTYTYGLFNSVSVDHSGFKAIKQFLKNPVIYAFLLGLILHTCDIKIPGFLWTPIKNSSNAFLAIALITLGAQSAYIKLRRFSLPLILSLIGRLILSPSIALLIIFLLKLDGTTAQALFIASSFPTSRNSALFALEYDNHPEYAAQVVLMSTLFSMITVTTVVFLSTIIF